MRPQEVTHEIDIVIEMGAILPIEWMRHVHALGAKIVCFGVGHNYNALAETIIFEKPVMFLSTPNCASRPGGSLNMPRLARRS